MARKSLGTFVSTSYGPPWGGIQGGGTTAGGVDLHGSPHINGVAVDPSVIPLGSILWIAPNPFNDGDYFVAFDTGGAIKGKRIDFYDWRGRSAQNNWGRRNVTVTIDGKTKNLKYPHDASTDKHKRGLAGALGQLGNVPGASGGSAFDPTDTKQAAAKVVDPLKDLANAAFHLIQWLTVPHNWLRVGEILAGGLALLVGAVTIGRVMGLPTPKVIPHV